MKEKTFFKNPNKSTCIDLYLTNSSHSFQKSSTGWSDFHLNNKKNQDHIEDMFMKTIKRQGPMKRKFVRTNEVLYIILLRHYGKQLWKGISWES